MVKNRRGSAKRTLSKQRAADRARARSKPYVGSAARQSAVARKAERARAREAAAKAAERTPLPGAGGAEGLAHERLARETQRVAEVQAELMAGERERRASEALASERLGAEASSGATPPYARLPQAVSSAPPEGDVPEALELAPELIRAALRLARTLALAPFRIGLALLRPREA
jgi:hypothetical protein